MRGKRLDVDRLFDVVVESSVEEALSIGAHGEGGEGDDDGRGGPAVAAQAAERGDAVEIRKLDVHQNQRRLPGGGDREAGMRVLRLDRRESMRLEQVANEAEVPLVVLDDEDQLQVFAAHGAFARMQRSSSSSSA